MKKINIIQFLPYFPPHKGGVETVGQEIGKYWVKNNLGEFVNLVFDVGQEKVENYEENGYKVYLLPSFDIISNFPFPKFWKREFWKVFKELKTYNSDIVFTHTRFFLSSLIGGIYARNNNKKWVHIEHGSDYVKLGSKIKSKISYIYDRFVGKWIFRKADKVVAISKVCKSFVNREFVEREVDVFYRGLEINDNIKIYENLKENFEGKIILGYVGRLYKWKNVESLIRGFYLLDENVLNRVELVVVGDGEDLERLKKIDKKNIIYFTGGKNFEEALSYQKQFDIHIHPSSPGGGLATTLLQAMFFGCLIVATPNEGANEVIMDNENGYLLNNDSVEEIKKGIERAILNIDKKDEFSLKNVEIINEKFVWENNIYKLYDLIK